MSTELQRYAENFEVYRHDADYRGNAKPASLLRYAQQVAGRHAMLVGVTDEVYAKTHTAYVLAKMALHIERMPRMDERLTLVTMPEKMKRAVNKRFTVIKDAAGEEIGCVDSRWVLIDTDKRSILRKRPEGFEESWAGDVERELPLKMQKAAPEACEVVGERTALYSMCDVNGHMNNTRYVDMVFDALPAEALQQNVLADLLVFYHKEVPMGQSLTLLRARLGENHWYFAGEREGKHCFEVELQLKPTAEAEK